MKFGTLVDPDCVASHLGDESWRIFDCRFSLAETFKGRCDYSESHIPGAVYAHLDEDLSGPLGEGLQGRHPLPDVDMFKSWLGINGVDTDTQVVAYDDMGGAVAARLWWMLRWLGHERVAVLNGGWQRWIKEERPCDSSTPLYSPTTFQGEPRFELVKNADEVELIAQDPSWRLIDSRGAVRYCGEQEPIDKVAGHIPGAINAPFPQNLEHSGNFHDQDTLAERFAQLLGEVPAERAVFYCGSGVTAAHNILAMVHAGMPMPCLYPGSWSGWIADGTRPIAVGTDP